MAGTPYTEGTGLICRIPSPGLCSNTPWASHPGAPVSVLGTDTTADCCHLFTGTGNKPKPSYWALSPLHPRLTITVLRGLIGFDRATALNGLSGCVSDSTETAMVQEY
jgi:hypothetical protein